MTKMTFGGVPLGVAEFEATANLVVVVAFDAAVFFVFAAVFEVLAAVFIVVLVVLVVVFVAAVATEPVPAKAGKLKATAAPRPARVRAVTAG